MNCETLLVSFYLEATAAVILTIFISDIPLNPSLLDEENY
jgi:hypothetical protein